MNLIIIALNSCSHWFPEATHVAMVNLLSIIIIIEYTSKYGLLHYDVMHNVICNLTISSYGACYNSTTIAFFANIKLQCLQ